MATGTMQKELLVPKHLLTEFPQTHKQRSMKKHLLLRTCDRRDNSCK